MIGSINRHGLERATLVLAVLWLGVMAGFFWTYSFNVNYAMSALDGSDYATVQSLLNQNVRHGAFFTAFFGAAAIPLLATVLNARHYRSAHFWLILAATLSYAIGVVVFTREVNLPLNYYTESWLPTSLPADWRETRAQWNAANDIRVAASLLAFAAATISLATKSQKQ